MLMEADAIARHLEAELVNWTRENDYLCRCYRTPDFRSAMLVANAVAHLAEAAWHHPDLQVRWGEVQVRLTTHSAQGLTRKDVELAIRIERVVAWRPGASSALEGPPPGERWQYLV